LLLEHAGRSRNGPAGRPRIRLLAPPPNNLKRLPQTASESVSVVADPICIPRKPSVGVANDRLCLITRSSHEREHIAKINRIRKPTERLVCLRERLGDVLLDVHMRARK